MFVCNAVLCRQYSADVVTAELVKTMAVYAMKELFGQVTHASITNLCPDATSMLTWSTQPHGCHIFKVYNIVTSLATLVPKLNNTVNVQYIETRNEECDEWFVISVATNELVEWYAQAQAVNYGMCTVFFFLDVRIFVEAPCQRYAVLLSLQSPCILRSV